MVPQELRLILLSFAVKCNIMRLQIVSIGQVLPAFIFLHQSAQVSIVVAQNQLIVFHTLQQRSAKSALAFLYSTSILQLRVRQHTATKRESCSGQVLFIKNTKEDKKY